MDDAFYEFEYFIIGTFQRHLISFSTTIDVLRLSVRSHRLPGVRRVVSSAGSIPFPPAFSPDAAAAPVGAGRKTDAGHNCVCGLPPHPPTPANVSVSATFRGQCRVGERTARVPPASSTDTRSPPTPTHRGYITYRNLLSLER